MPTLSTLLSRAPLGVIFLASGWLTAPAPAQIVPDASLPQPSQVLPQGQITTISGGTAAGGNLFHSFEQFSLPTGSEALFTTSPGVERIISRVTGEEPSSIDGVIRAEGSADLFLLNPNGLFLGPNAALDIGGSFVGSTANSLVFADGLEFSTQISAAPPLLSVNLPVGLQFTPQADPDSGSISVQGPGHDLFFLFPEAPDPTQLQVPPGETLALVGRDLSLTGGLVSAPSGRVELGAVETGQVQLLPEGAGWRLLYDETEVLGDIHLTEGSLADASGVILGAVQMQGATLQFSETSLALVQGLNTLDPERVTLRATESIEMQGGTAVLLPDGFELPVGSGVLVENFGPDPGGLIRIETPLLRLTEEAAIASSGLDSGPGPDIEVEATQIQLQGGAERQSQITAQSVFEADTGSITLRTQELQAINGGSIGTQTAGNGDSGDVRVQADSIEVSGVGSVISTASINFGDAGDLYIDTQRLTVNSGGQVTASTVLGGAAGQVEIQATDFVRVEGTGQRGNESPTRSQISSAGLQLDAAELESLLLPPDSSPTGAIGQVEIETPDLQVRDGAVISVAHAGTGDAGNLQIRANRIQIETGGELAAETAAGQGGDIDLQVRDLLQIQTGGRITALAQGEGDGGNIEIGTAVLVATPGSNSDIISTALTGAGGRIQITAEGIFGFEVITREAVEAEFGEDLSEFDPADLPSNDIIAISQADPALNGEVILDSPDVDPASGALVVPSDLVNLAELIASTCTPQSRQSNFLITGRGGVVPDPLAPLTPAEVWVDLRIVLESTSTKISAAPPEPQNGSSFQDTTPSQPLALWLQCPRSGR